VGEFPVGGGFSGADFESWRVGLRRFH
jgi:hypothetical protein